MSKAIAESLTQKESAMLAAAWMSCETPPKPDYEKIADICGYKNGASVATMFGHLRRKLLAGSGANQSTPSKKRAAESDGVGSAKRATKKRNSAKKGSDKTDEDEDNAAVPTTPTVKKGASSQKVTKVKKEALTDDDAALDNDDLEALLYPQGSYGVFNE